MNTIKKMLVVTVMMVSVAAYAGWSVDFGTAADGGLTDNGVGYYDNMPSAESLSSKCIWQHC